MSMPTAALTDFIANVPSCVDSTSLASAMEIFSRGQRDQLVVLDQQKCPVGLVRLHRLMPVIASAQFGVAATSSRPELEQPISALELSLIEPLVKIPAQMGVEQFRTHLGSQVQTENSLDLALVDSSGKFLGLLDSPRLLQFLAVSPTVINSSQAVGDSVDFQDALVQLLQQLPWPLLLQTSTGVVAQNGAWQQQLGASTAAIGQEVEAVLAPSGEYCIVIGQEQWQFIKIPLHDFSLGAIPASPLQNLEPLKPHLWLLLAHNVTEQHQLVSELAAKNADLIQLNRLKDEFLACISHELKTPLTAVLGLSNLLKDQALGHLNERQVRYAHLIHQSGRHLMTVVNDILDLTRMETGQLELTLESVQIKTVCDRAIQQAEAIHAGAKHPQVAELRQVSSDHHFVAIESGLEDLVADELRLRQMLVHLLSNAFKFTEAGGKVGLCVNRWEGWIAFTVWDTGIGIPEQQQHLIFQKFQQLENPLTRRFEGTGLGLVLTRALARLHGGDVSFLSKEGKGSQFTLLLPPSPPQKEVGGWGYNLARSTQHATTPVASTEGLSARRWLLSPQHAALNTHPNRLVLVVEAAPRYIENLTEQLTELGYRVAIARLGTEALEKARRLQPGAIFLNPLLPLLCGWDVLTLLKSDAATRQIPVIVTATRAEKGQALANRADGFLSLPVQPLDLQQILMCFCGAPLVQSAQRSLPGIPPDTPLTILRLINAQSLPLVSCSLPHNYRVIETSDLEQAEILARVWQPTVALLDPPPEPHVYLQRLTQHARLRGLPIVTLDAATTQAASQIPELAVFPFLTPAEALTIDALLPVLQIAAGIRWKPSILLVDIATLPDLQAATDKPQPDFSQHQPHILNSKFQARKNENSSNPKMEELSQPAEPSFPSISRGSEWFQALIQYLQKAGYRGAMSRSWGEVLQQIRQQSVDLLLICLGETELHPVTIAALTALEQQYIPPVLVLDHRCSQGEKQPHAATAVATDWQSPCPLDPSAPLDPLSAIATRILPSSLSVAELLTEIGQTLAAHRQ